MAANIWKAEVRPVLQFAVDLTRQDLDLLDARGRSILLGSFLRALGQESKGVWGRRAGTMVHSCFREMSPENFGRSEWEGLKDAIQTLIGTVRSQAIRATALPSLRFVLLPGKKRRQLQVAGTARDVFLYLLHAALAMGERDAILFCPECRGPFLAEGKRRFCDRACANRAMYRRWSERHGQPAVRAKNRKTYAKAQGRRKVMTYARRQSG